MNHEEYRKKTLAAFSGAEEEIAAYVAPNIEKYRKGTVKLRLTEKNGKPIAGKRVHIAQQTHDFKYGANIFLLDEFPDGERNLRYRDAFADYFNLATVPFYWSELEPTEGALRFAANSPKIYRRPAPDLCLNYCREKEIDAKLHCLFYDKFIPDWLPRGNESEMLRLYEKRFCEIAERYGNRQLYEIEVSNEVLENYGWKTKSVLSDRRDTPLWAWQMAKQYFPNDRLVINETNKLTEVAQHTYRSSYFLMLENLFKDGARIDKIGVQHHIFIGASGTQEEELPKFLPMLDPKAIIKGLQILSTFGKPLEITEVTIPTLDGDEWLQAELLRHMYEIWFATPQMASVIYWNTADGTAYTGDANWNENNVCAGLFHPDMTPKPAAEMLKHLFGEVWHTELDLETDASGCADFRGFYGDYEAKVGEKTARFGLHQDAKKITDLTI